MAASALDRSLGKEGASHRDLVLAGWVGCELVAFSLCATARFAQQIRSVGSARRLRRVDWHIMPRASPRAIGTSDVASMRWWHAIVDDSGVPGGARTRSAHGFGVGCFEQRIWLARTWQRLHAVVIVCCPGTCRRRSRNAPSCERCLPCLERRIELAVPSADNTRRVVVRPAFSHHTLLSNQNMCEMARRQNGWARPKPTSDAVGLRA